MRPSPTGFGFIQALNQSAQMASCWFGDKRFCPGEAQKIAAEAAARGQLQVIEAQRQARQQILMERQAWIDKYAPPIIATGVVVLAAGVLGVFVYLKRKKP